VGVFIGTKNNAWNLSENFRRSIELLSVQNFNRNACVKMTTMASALPHMEMLVSPLTWPFHLPTRCTWFYQEECGTHVYHKITLTRHEICCYFQQNILNTNERVTSFLVLHQIVSSRQPEGPSLKGHTT
jgi:hypothetical protein